MSTSTAKFDIACPANADIIVPHYYIMGFQYSPSSATLAAKAQIPNYFIKTTVDTAWGSSDATGWGPIVKIDTYGGALKKLKVAFVLTVLRGFSAASGYPNTLQTFSYSGIYMGIDLTNTWRPVVKDANKYNRERFNLARLSYGIYGLVSFKLNPSANCKAIDLDVEVKDINSAIFRTDNTDSLEDVVIAGDFFSGSNLQVCGSGVGTTPSRTMTQIKTKVYKTIPDFSFDGQDIQLTDNNPTTLKLTGTSLDSGSSTITYNVTLNYEGFLSGSSYRISLLLKEALQPWATSFANVASQYIQWTAQLDGVTIYTQNISSTSTAWANKQDVATLGIAIKNTNPVFRFLVTIPRPVVGATVSPPPVLFDSELQVLIE